MSEQVEQLGPGGEFISSLNSKWEEYQMDEKIDFYRVCGLNDWVVHVESAVYSLNTDKTSTFAGRDHFDIIKPKDNRDAPFLVTYNYLAKFRKRIELQQEKEDELSFYPDDL
jgi:hypothetical protein